MAAASPLADAVAHAIRQLDALAGLCNSASLHDEQLPLDTVTAAVDKVRSRLVDALDAEVGR